MNPFDLGGPQFLALYAGFAALVFTALLLTQRSAEAGGTNLRLTDPYLIAYLRGGPREALRLVVIGLVSRGLLDRSGTRLETTAGTVLTAIDHGLERAVLLRFQGGADEATVVFDNAALGREAGELGRTLERHGLLPDEHLRRARRGRLLLALSLLVGVAFVKVMVALSRGRSFGFLLLLTALATIIACRVTDLPRTSRGDAVLEDLRTLFARLRQRASDLAPDQAEEALMLAAIFGFKALPASWIFAKDLFPRAARDQSLDTGWSQSGGGAGCGSSGGSSCGSSCGGGCGGGCGGCGS